jgi:hypothetical protein
MLVAGLDVGNATTEVVIASTGRDGVRPLGRLAARTSGRKGSPESLRGARRLLEKGERELGRRCDHVAVCELHPVDTVTFPMAASGPDGGPVELLSDHRSKTPAGRGFASGRHVSLDLLEHGDPDDRSVVVSVGPRFDFEEAARLLGAAVARGWRVCGVVTAGDDAVLIHNRIDVSVPIVDEVDLRDLPAEAPIALEVAEDGRTLERLSDPAALLTSLELPEAQLPAVSLAARQLVGRRCAAVTLARPRGRRAPAPAAGYLEVDTEGAARQIPLNAELGGALSGVPPGASRALVRLSTVGVPRHFDIDDAWAPDLRRIDHIGWLRRGVARLDRFPLALLRAGQSPPLQLLAEELRRPVLAVGVEARAAATGALTTPGAPSNAAVLDIGAGTIDLFTRGRTISAAGGGELLTIAVAQMLGLSRALAERVKRGPALQIATPHLAHHEDGSRRFIAPPAAGATVGQLAVGEGSGLTPFLGDVAPQEWRGLRHALKEHVLGANVRRCLLGIDSGTLVVAGGGALDHELVYMLGEHLREYGWVVARAHVAGRFGSRFAVAWGAVLMGIEDEPLAAA